LLNISSLIKAGFIAYSKQKKSFSLEKWGLLLTPCPPSAKMGKIFYYAGFIESWGHGTIKIVENCIKQGLPEPDFSEENGVMTVTFYKDRLNEENLKKLGLNARQIKAVKHIKENKIINLSSYKALIKNISEKTLYRDLQDLVDKNILKEIGEKRGRKYELA